MPHPEPQERSKELVKLNAEYGQLESALQSDRATAQGLEQTVTETQKAQAKARSDLKKAADATEKAQAAHSERARDLQAKREQYEAQMGLASASGDGAKNLQVQPHCSTHPCGIGRTAFWCLALLRASYRRQRPT